MFIDFYFLQVTYLPPSGICNARQYHDVKRIAVIIEKECWELLVWWGNKSLKAHSPLSWTTWIISKWRYLLHVVDRWALVLDVKAFVDNWMISMYCSLSCNFLFRWFLIKWKVVVWRGYNDPFHNQVKHLSSNERNAVTSDCFPSGSAMFDLT